MNAYKTPQIQSYSEEEFMSDIALADCSGVE